MQQLLSSLSFIADVIQIFEFIQKADVNTSINHILVLLYQVPAWTEHIVRLLL
jgi:hypothetical protein